MSRRPRKGDRLIYTGPYAAEVAPDAQYGVGEVVGFRNYGTKVTVRLVEEDEELYADWPVAETAPAPPVTP
jgi:hypothetical protein